MRKNGSVVSDAQVDIEIIDGDSVSYNPTTKKITPEKEGVTDIKLTVKDVTVGGKAVSKTVSFDVKNYFFAGGFNSGLSRGDVNYTFETSKTDPRVTINGGQACVLAKNASVNFVMECELTVEDNENIATNSSFGVAAFNPVGGSIPTNGDKAFFIGLKNGTSSQTGNTFSQYACNFLDGWDNRHDKTSLGYDDLGTNRDSIKCKIIRVGKDFYYSLDGHYDHFEFNDANKDIPLYPGVYSQGIPLVIRNFSYSDTQADIAEAIEALGTGATVIKINETYNDMILKGSDPVQFTADAYGGGEKKTVTLVWDIDDSEKTGTVSFANNGTLTVGNDAAGVVTLICKIDGTDIEKRHVVEILQESLERHNEMFDAYGGVVLTEGVDNALSFPEKYKGKNGAGLSVSDMNEGLNQFLKTTYYAITKQPVATKGCFNMSFKFKNYISNTSTPKFQVSIGDEGTYDCNFFIVDTGDGFQLQANTKATVSDREANRHAAGWYNSQVVQVDRNAEYHTFMLAVSRDGGYLMTIDGNTLNFTYTGNGVSEGAHAATIGRSYADFTTDRYVKFATQNCSVDVYDIAFGNSGADISKFYSENRENVVSNTGFAMPNPGASGWSYHNDGQYMDYKIFYTDKESIAGNYVMEFDVDFSSSYNDGKLDMHLGNQKINFVNNGANLAVEKNEWTAQVAVDRVDGALKMHVRVERSGDNLRLIVNNKIVNETTVSGRDLWFAPYSGTNDNNGKTITVSNFTVTTDSVTVKDVYNITAASSVLNVNADDWTNIVTSITHNKAAAEKPQDYTVDYELSGETWYDFDLDEEKGRIKAKASATENSKCAVTILLKDDQGNTVDWARVQVNCKPTSNAYVTTYGGVELNNASTANWSLTFPETFKDVSAANDYNYEEKAGYYAKLKDTVSGDFSLSFTVSGYHKSSSNNYPKLQISLGGDRNQFFISYDRVNNQGRWQLESWTNAIDNDGKQEVNWHNVPFDADINASHNFVISVTNGIYSVSVDGTPIDFGGKTIYRSGYGTELPILFTTQGAYCTVSNISLVKTENASKPIFNYKNSSNVSNVTTNGATITFGNQGGWDVSKNFNQGRIEYFPGMAANQTLEFDLKADDCKDSKLVLFVAGRRVMIDLKTDGNVVTRCNVVNGNDDGGDSGIGAWNEAGNANVGSISENPLHVKVVRSSNRMEIYFNGTKLSWTENDNTVNSRDAAANDTLLAFGVFKGNDDSAENKVVISNISITPNSNN